MPRRSTPFALVLILALSCAPGFVPAAGAQGAPADPAPAETPDQLSYPPLPEIEIPTPRRVVLDNGMVVMLIEDHELPLVHASALVRTGSRHDPPEKVGLGSLAGQVLRAGGTRDMPADALDDFLESRAATIESATGQDRGRVSMGCLADDFPEVFRVFGEVIRHPAFAADRLEVAKTGARASVSRQNDDPQQIVFREVRQQVFGEDSPYARVPTYATLAAVSRDDLVAWHETYFQPDRVVLGLVGDFDSDEVLEHVREAFGDWTGAGAGSVLEPWYEEEPNPGVFLADKSDVTQANIALGHLGIRRDHPDYYAIRVLNELVSGSMSSRLMTEIRTERGLAYGVTGRVGSDWDHPGLTLAWTSTKVETTAEALGVLLEEIGALRGERPPTEEEVAEAKRALLASFVFEVDSRSEILGEQLVLEAFDYPLDRLAVFRDRIDGVTVDAVRRAASEHFHPDRFSIVVVGPADRLEDPLATFGEVTPLDISIPEPPED